MDTHLFGMDLMTMMLAQTACRTPASTNQRGSAFPRKAGHSEQDQPILPDVSTDGQEGLVYEL